MRDEKSSLRSLLCCAVVVIAALAAFVRILGNGFSYDDYPTVVDNDGIRSLLAPKTYFTRDYFQLSGEATYRPLVTASYAFDYRLWKLNPVGYHLTNLLWHCLASVLFFFACRSLNGSPGISTLAASVYAVHPAQSEAVCGVGFREDVMCAAFYLAAFALWPVSRISSIAVSLTSESPQPSGSKMPDDGVRHGRRQRAAKDTANRVDSPPSERANGSDWPRTAASLACFALALLSKEMALSFPLLAMAKEWRAAHKAGESGPGRLKARAPRYALVWIVALAAFVLFLAFSGSAAATKATPAVPLVARLAAFPVISCKYIRLLLLPYPLRVEYALVMKGAAFWLSALGAFTALTAFGTHCYWRRRQTPYALESFAAYFLLLGPVSNVVPLLHPMAERYLPLPLAAFGWLVAHVVSGIERQWTRRAVMGGLLAAYLFLSYLRVSDWRTEESLWGAEVRHDPHSSWAHNGLGLALHKRKQIDQAISHYAEALRLKPDYADAHCNMGNALMALDRLDEAVSHYSESLRLRPDSALTHYNLGLVLAKMGQMDRAIFHYQEALRIRPFYADAHNNLGLALSEKARYQDAILHLSEAVRIRPDSVETRVNYGAVLQKMGNLEEAARQYAEALRIDPESAAAHNNLGATLEKMGETDRAIEQYSEALRLKPDYAAAHINMGVVIGKSGKIEQAVASFNQALKCDPGNAQAHYNLGYALSARAKWDEAIREYSEALRLNPSLVDAHNNLGDALEKTGKIDLAIEHYSKVLEIQPDHAIALANLGCASIKKGKLGEAISLLTKALKSDPNLPEAHEAIAAAYEKTGRLNDAVDHYRQFVAKRPEAANGYFSLGRTLAELGQNDEARTQFRNALSRAEATTDTALVSQVQKALEELR